MRKVFPLLSLFALLLLSQLGFGQCTEYNVDKCNQRLSPYTNYGGTISTNLSGGEYAELNMTFFAKQDYRLAVCGLENVADLEFRVYDADHNLLYKNKDSNYSRTWDFKLEVSMQLIIAIIVPESVGNVSGCVAVSNGLKMKQ